MNVASIEWRLAGCGIDCLPGRHDPLQHEAHGRLLEREAIAGRVIVIGPLVIDRLARRVLVGGDAVALTLIEWEILAVLARDVGRSVAHDEILAEVWGPGYEDRPILRTNMDRLRRKLGEAGCLIETLVGHGYRLATDARSPAALPRPAPRPPRWAHDWDACQWCHTTDRRHVALGLCTRCYWHRKKMRKSL